LTAPLSTMDVFAAEVAGGAAALPEPGGGRTAERFAAFIRWGRRDPVLARLLEGHADARAILAELGGDDPSGAVWGVWAAVPPSVRATRCGSGWQVDGARPWCSGAGTCTHAIVTAEADDGPRLFAVEVREPWATPVPGTWPAVGMAGSDSRSVRFEAAPAVAVGGVGDYVNRPGFWHGGIGVAACWYGGAVGVADTLLSAARSKDLDPHALAHLGAVDATLAAGAAVLNDAAARIDTEPNRQQPRLARRVRATVEDCAT
jgi:alkylation response protein AidB-like acyl-CoA dehydrogenase